MLSTTKNTTTDKGSELKFSGWTGENVSLWLGVTKTQSPKTQTSDLTAQTLKTQTPGNLSHAIFIGKSQKEALVYRCCFNQTVKN